MAELELHGYLTTGKFYVNDYVIEIERVTEGLEMTVTDNNAGTKQSVTVKDGEAGMTQEQIAAINAMIEKFQKSEDGRNTAEAARVAAEKLRDEAENGASGETDQTKYRTGLYQLMKDLYDKLKDYPSTVEDYKKQAEDAAKDAKTSADNAAASAESAAKSEAKDFSSIYFTNGESVTFKASGISAVETVTGGVKSTMTSKKNNVSAGLCASGYVTDERKKINIKIPLGKRLTNVTAVTCTSFMANIMNNGGYGINRDYVAEGANYLSQITGILIDKVQNCLQIVITNESQYHLTNDDAVSCRCGGGDGDGISFTFTAPETTTT